MTTELDLVEIEAAKGELVKFFEEFKIDETVKDINLSDTVEINGGDTYTLCVDWKGRLGIKFHSNDTTLGHSAETSKRNFNFHRDLVGYENRSPWKDGDDSLIYYDKDFARILVDGGVRAEKVKKIIEEIKKGES